MWRWAAIPASCFCGFKTSGHSYSHFYPNLFRMILWACFPPLFVCADCVLISLFMCQHACRRVGVDLSVCLLAGVIVLGGGAKCSVGGSACAIGSLLINVEGVD